MGKPSHRLEHNAEASEEHGARSERADPNAKPLRAVLSHPRCELSLESGSDGLAPVGIQRAET